MRRTPDDKLVSRFIQLGLIFVTVLVVTQSVTDPVNAPKLFLLGGFSLAAFGAASRNMSSLFFKNRRIPLIALLIFSISSVSTLIASPAPLSQSLYGVYGRNNGYLLYLFLVLLSIATLTITNQAVFKRALTALIISGSLNVLYALWVLAFGDFIGWNNPYGNLLGTLGNPNFIGSFFGMYAALLWSFAIAPTSSKRIQVFALLSLPLVFLGIVQSHAVQGKVLFIAGFGIATFYWVRDRFPKNIFSLAYLLFLGAGFLVGLLGTLQKGPLAELLYKETVSLRGQYWYAGWKTGLSNPVFGAGFDSFGDWYRRSRRESALQLPGIDTVTNASHNVHLDMFAFGGWPLFLSHLLLIFLVTVSIVKFSLRTKKFDSIFVSMTSIWICYQLQASISINQVGLAIWGWVLGAAIIAYEINGRNPKTEVQESKTSIKKSSLKDKRVTDGGVISAGLVGGLAGLLGLIISAPPLSADMKWRSAQTSQSAEQVEKSLESSYMNPLNTFEYNNIVGVFETNGLYDLAHTYALKSVTFNKDSYEAWRNLNQIKNSTAEERALAVQNMKRLDPLNPNVEQTNK